MYTRKKEWCKCKVVVLLKKPIVFFDVLFTVRVVGSYPYCVVAVHCPSEVLNEMDTEELKCRDLFNIGHSHRDWS